MYLPLDQVVQMASSNRHRRDSSMFLSPIAASGETSMAESSEIASDTSETILMAKWPATTELAWLGTKGGGA